MAHLFCRSLEMRLGVLSLVCILVTTGASHPMDSPADPAAAYGFGAATKGGSGGAELLVTSLDDDPKSPQPGTLRWAVERKGPRIIRFRAAGNLRLRTALEIHEPFLTIDGSDAPGFGVCLCDHSLQVKDTHDIIVRHIRVRRGDVTVLKRNRQETVKRPKNSGDLDCIAADDSHNLLFDHISASWCTDEVFSIVRCRNVTIQWCLLSEPLSNPALHPYGDNHAYCLNTSASTLSVHHCPFAHYVMRGPPFEANDVRRDNDIHPRFEAVNNVMFDYQRSGSRYTTGIEDRPEEAAEKTFQFHFVGNYYLNGLDRPEIDAERKHGESQGVAVYVAGNLGPHRSMATDDEWNVLFAGEIAMRSAPDEIRRQVSTTPLFQSPAPIPPESAAAAMKRVLAEAGCSIRRDEVDRRIIDEVRNRNFGRVIRSQADVGGWPNLDER